jgi:hypothetical protein
VYIKAQRLGVCFAPDLQSTKTSGNNQGNFYLLSCQHEAHILTISYYEDSQCSGSIVSKKEIEFQRGSAHRETTQDPAVAVADYTYNDYYSESLCSMDMSVPLPTGISYAIQQIVQTNNNRLSHEEEEEEEEDPTVAEIERYSATPNQEVVLSVDAMIENHCLSLEGDEEDSTPMSLRVDFPVLLIFENNGYCEGRPKVRWSRSIGCHFKTESEKETKHLILPMLQDDEEVLTTGKQWSQSLRTTVMGLVSSSMSDHDHQAEAMQTVLSMKDLTNVDLWKSLPDVTLTEDDDVTDDDQDYERDRDGDRDRDGERDRERESKGLNQEDDVDDDFTIDIISPTHTHSDTPSLSAVHDTDTNPVQWGYCFDLYHIPTTVTEESSLSVSLSVSRSLSLSHDQSITAASNRGDVSMSVLRNGWFVISYYFLDPLRERQTERKGERVRETEKESLTSFHSKPPNVFCCLLIMFVCMFFLMNLMKVLVISQRHMRQGMIPLSASFIERKDIDMIITSVDNHSVSVSVSVSSSYQYV